MGAALIHADETDVTKLIDAFHDYANAHKNATGKARHIVVLFYLLRFPVSVSRL